MPKGNGHVHSNIHTKKRHRKRRLFFSLLSVCGGKIVQNNIRPTINQSIYKYKRILHRFILTIMKENETGLKSEQHCKPGADESNVLIQAL